MMQNLTSSPSFPNFRPLDLEAGVVRFVGVIGGEGLPMLPAPRLSADPCSVAQVAPKLAQRHTLIIPDLPGYGASRPRQMLPRWTKRRAGEALVALMAALGYDHFAVVGHDRGARVGYRLALDHPSHVASYASLAVVPILDAVPGVDLGFATKNFH